ncbi:hypothetical protein V8B97DRAFT_772630 [Scleroderma yunnanense]
MATIAGTCGALLLGGLVAFGLSGCVNMQFAMYWRVYPKDTWQTKSLVTLTWIVDISHSVFIAISLWDSIIGPNGDFSPEQLNKIPWSVAMAAEFGVVTTFLSQSFFAHRIYILQKHWLVAVPVATLAFCRLVAATVSVSQLVHLAQYSLLRRPFPAWVITLGLSLSVFIDIAITGSLCHFFRQTRKGMSSVFGITLNPPGSSTSTQRILHTLTVWTMRNGLITSWVASFLPHRTIELFEMISGSTGAAASLICWLSVPHTLLFLGIHFVMGKLYANSLLATLNSRERIRRPHMYDTSAVTSPAVFFPQDFGMDVSDSPLNSITSAGPKGLGHPIQVNVECSTVSMVDRNAVTSSSNMVSEQIHLENRYQKGEAPV